MDLSNAVQVGALVSYFLSPASRCATATGWNPYACMNTGIPPTTYPLATRWLAFAQAGAKIPAEWDFSCQLMSGVCDCFETPRGPLMPAPSAPLTTQTQARVWFVRWIRSPATTPTRAGRGFSRACGKVAGRIAQNRESWRKWGGSENGVSQEVCLVV